jgi:hypothetical protein
MALRSSDLLDDSCCGVKWRRATITRHGEQATDDWQASATESDWQSNGVLSRPTQKSIRLRKRPKTMKTTKKQPASAGRMPRFVRWALARFRLNLRVVCEESAGMGIIDYHDYPDADPAIPWHMATHTCRRCGKKFFI